MKILLTFIMCLFSLLYSYICQKYFTGDHYVRLQWGFPCSLGMGASTHVDKFSGILEYITLPDRNITAFYTESVITEFCQSGIYGTQSYWVRITSGMFPRHVPTSRTWLFVRQHFLGLIFSWGPVRSWTLAILSKQRTARTRAPYSWRSRRPPRPPASASS